MLFLYLLSFARIVFAMKIILPVIEAIFANDTYSFRKMKRWSRIAAFQFPQFIVAAETVNILKITSTLEATAEIKE